MRADLYDDRSGAHYTGLMPRVPQVRKRVSRDRAYFDMTWSPLEPVSRHRINAAVPSLPGIWEVYWLRHSREPVILKMGRAWHGGLRHTLRFECDAGEPVNRDHRDYLASGDCYYRYTICENAADLTDLYSTLVTLRPLPQPEAFPTGRYRDVRLREPDEMTIHRVRVPGEEPTRPVPFGTVVPNMFDVAREMNLLPHTDGSTSSPEARGPA